MAASVAVDLQRFGLAAGAVEGEHLLAADPLARRVLGGAGRELDQQVGVAAACEVGVDAILDRLEPALVEARRVLLHGGLVRDVGERVAVPQVERLAQEPRGGVGVAVVERGATAVGERREALRVELVGADLERVRVPACDQGTVAERLAQRRNEVVQAATGRGRRGLSPQCVDQPVTRERLGRMQQQDRQQEPLPALAERHLASAVLHSDRAKDRVPHGDSQPTVPAFVSGM